MLWELLAEALEHLSGSPKLSGLLHDQDFINASGIVERKLQSADISLAEVLSFLAISSTVGSEVRSNRNKRTSLRFQHRPAKGHPGLIYTENSTSIWSLDPATVEQALVEANTSFELIHDLSLAYGIKLYELLGLRNLSSFVGEVFARKMRDKYTNRLMSNPNQDGYPDLCALTPEGKKWIEKHAIRGGIIDTDKTLWSYYRFGGVEVKATCGNTPGAKIKKKPGIGDSRLPITTTAEWKSHHQGTKQLLGVYWDFVDTLPTVLAVFFRNDLDTSQGNSNKDWGGIVQPHEGGGRTTSVSIMRRGSSADEGVRKMGHGWLVLPENKEFLVPIQRIFLGSKISKETTGVLTNL